MWGQCKNCNKLFDCRNPHKWGCGFCETDFEPKQQPKKKPALQITSGEAMKWLQISSTKWSAKGSEGTFYIERSRGLFWGRYVSVNNGKSFKMRPKKKLSEAKACCEDNFYWE